MSSNREQDTTPKYLHLTKHEKLRLVALVSDCITYRFSEEESLIYIKARLQKDVPLGTYRRYKTFLRSGKGADIWLENQARVGFAIAYRERTDEMLKIQDEVMHDLAMEMIKPRAQRDGNLIKSLRLQALLVNKRLIELQLGQPVIGKMRQIVKDSEKMQIMITEGAKKIADGLSDTEMALPGTSETLTFDEMQADSDPTFVEASRQALEIAAKGKEDSGKELPPPVL